MKNKTKIILLVSTILIVIAILSISIFKYVNDENKLTIDEKKWINNNISTVQNVNVINNIDIVGKNGSGVFYDFIDDFKREYNLTINPITYSSNEIHGERTFKIVNELKDNHLLFKEEHYVLITNKSDRVITNSKVGVLSSDEQLVREYIRNDNITFVGYENSEKLFASLNGEEPTNFILLPQDEYLSQILSGNYTIVKHYSEIKKYFVYEMQNDDTFSEILKKYFNKYKDKYLEKSINENTLDTFIDSLGITEKEFKAIQAKEYNYAFVNNSPYQVLTGGNYGGIVSEYLRRFSNITNTDFKFTKYKNYSSFKDAIAENKVDIYFNYVDMKTEYKTISNVLPVSYAIISPISNNLVVNSIESLKKVDIFVLENSIVANYLKTHEYINVITYKNDKELKKAIKNGEIIAIDKQVYENDTKSLFQNYNVKYSEEISEKYSFKLNVDDTFYSLFSKYISTLDEKEVTNTGLYNHMVTIKNGTIAGKIARYSLIIIAIISVILFFIYKSSKKIKIAKKIKKEDKLRYIDQLTSLKNINYLTENIVNWNKNTIYPQATVVIDLDQLQNINDTLGYEAGDEQIKAAANILIKTQLDNSDIIRTDGNEFLVYLVGYQEKQVVSYIRKLYKEFKNLPHEYGATIGHSMILDDIKTIEDAVNEAVDAMKLKKEEQ